MKNERTKRLPAGSHVFVYGTLKRGHHNHQYLEDAYYVGEARLFGHTLYSINDWFPAMIELGPQKSDEFVLGEVFEVTENHVAGMDCLESEGSMYKRVDVTVKLIVDPEENPDGAYAEQELQVQTYVWCQPQDGMNADTHVGSEWKNREMV